MNGADVAETVVIALWTLALLWLHHQDKDASRRQAAQTSAAIRREALAMAKVKAAAPALPAAEQQAAANGGGS